MGRGGLERGPGPSAQWPFNNNDYYQVRSMRKLKDQFVGTRWHVKRVWILVVAIASLVTLASVSPMANSIQATIFLRYSSSRKLATRDSKFQDFGSGQFLWERRTEQMISFPAANAVHGSDAAAANVHYNPKQPAKKDHAASGAASGDSRFKSPFDDPPSEPFTKVNGPAPYIEDMVALPEDLDLFLVMVRDGHSVVRGSISACKYGEKLNSDPHVVDFLPDGRLAVTCTRPSAEMTATYNLQKVRIKDVSLEVNGGKSPPLLPKVVDEFLEPAPWNGSLVYAVQSTEEDVVLYVKGGDSQRKKAEEYTDLNNFRCLFESEQTVETSVTAAALEIFRCGHPNFDMIQTTTASKRMKVHMLYKGDRISSVAYYEAKVGSKKAASRGGEKMDVGYTNESGKVNRLGDKLKVGLSNSRNVQSGEAINRPRGEKLDMSLSDSRDVKAKDAISPRKDKLNVNSSNYRDVKPEAATRPKGGKGKEGFSNYKNVASKKKHLICSCTMIWNVAKFLKEWVLYNADLGVEKFFLYDNNSEDGIEKVVSSLAQYNVTRTNWPWVKTQEAGFSHCAIEAQRECTWVLFTDVDEYVFPKRWLQLTGPGRVPQAPAAAAALKSPLQSLIEDTLKMVILSGKAKAAAAHQKGNLTSNSSIVASPPLKVGQIAFRCRNFGPSGRTTNPPEGVTQGYTCRDLKELRHKSMVYFPAVQSSLRNVIHHFYLTPEYRTIYLDVRQAVVNHYKFQSWSEFATKFTKRASTYVVDWKEPKSIGSKDRPDGVGLNATKPADWETSHCEINDTALRDYTRRQFGPLGTQTL